MLQETVDDLQARGVAQESDGCMCVFLEVRPALTLNFLLEFRQLPRAFI